MAARRLRRLTASLERTTASGSVRRGTAHSIRGEAALRGVSEHRVRTERREAVARATARAAHREAAPEELKAARAIAAGHGARVGAGALGPITVLNAEGEFVQIRPTNAAMRAKLGRYLGALEQFYRTGDTTALDKFSGYHPQGVELGTDPDTLEAVDLTTAPDDFLSYLDAS